jgi:lysylphosphatidylglycerol synthetase-like protein (DUF2156 family)
MTRLRRLTIMILLAVGVADLVGVPFMVAANHANPNALPGFAMPLGVAVAVLTLAGAVGLARGSRWAWWLSLIVRIVDTVTSVLGVTGRPSTALTVISGCCLIGSVVAIVLLARLRRRPQDVQRRPAERATTSV